MVGMEGSEKKSNIEKLIKQLCLVKQELSNEEIGGASFLNLEAFEILDN